MSTWQKLEDEKLKIYCNNITLERVSEWKLVVATTDENLMLNEHVPLLLKTVTQI